MCVQGCSRRRWRRRLPSSDAKERARIGVELREPARMRAVVEVGPVIVSALILDQFTGYTRVYALSPFSLQPSSTRRSVSSATNPVNIHAHTHKRHTHVQRCIMYSHVRTLARTVPTLTAWCNREPSWKLTLPTRQPASLSDQPTDVIQRHGVLPQPRKTIRLRSHCWGSHYLALSIGETIFGTRTNTRPFLFPSWISPPWLSVRASRTQGNGLATIFRMACPEATIPFSFPRKS